MVQRAWLDAISVVRVDGEIDLGNAEVLEGPIEEALSARPEGLIVDLTEVRFFGSSGLSRLVDAAERSEATGALMSVVSTRREVLRPIRATGLSGYLRVRSSVSEAARDLVATR
ncbi:anti-sigma factor antagonist [Amycolatopsis aidingensis]|uniref:anti-sigma factor antagonist n=1 Tax=Amycolatopsis aidingensis TaxID=2842453 RepID=UPI001C0C8EF5|nr:anti-sigma factor antagonist [Amycolatopsis aidingensis]